MVRTVHAAVAAGNPAIAWPAVIPELFRDRLRSRHGLRDRLQTYATALATLTADQQARVLVAVGAQNDLVNLLSCAAHCESVTLLPEAIRTPARSLFSFAFELLTELGIRDRHYHVIWERSKQHVCPFCGCEFFDAPGAPRENDDHYLAESRYPYAAANLANLVPMGAKCNQRYKQAIDILNDDAGARRRAFYPYSAVSVTVCLDASEPFAAPDGRTPRWVIDLVPPSPECETWDHVFKIRERYQRDILDPFFIEWLRPLTAWWNKDTHANPVTDAVLIDALSRYINDLVAMEMTGRDFLRAPMFVMLHKRCVAGDQRLLRFLRTVVGA
jgi:hypothetical protein